MTDKPSKKKPDSFAVAPIGTPGDIPAAWKTMWRKRHTSGRIQCRKCGLTMLKGFASECRECGEKFVRLESRVQTYVAQKPVWDALFEATVGQKMRLPDDYAREINGRNPGALKRFRRSEHGPLESLSWAEPHFNTMDAIMERARRAWKAPPDWRTMPVRLVNEIIQLRQEDKIADRVRLPRNENASDLVEFIDDREMWYKQLLVQRELVRKANMLNPLYACLSQEGRWCLMEWCSKYRAWGKRMIVPGSASDSTQAILQEPVIGWLIKLRPRFESADAFLDHLLKMGGQLKYLGLPTTRTQLRAKLQQLNVLPRSIRAT